MTKMMVTMGRRTSRACSRGKKAGRELQEITVEGGSELEDLYVDEAVRKSRLRRLPIRVLPAMVPRPRSVLAQVSFW
jgi:hypothetical protein